MKFARTFTLILSGFALLSLSAESSFAQNPLCHIPPGTYCTGTQGGWGQDACNGNNYNCRLTANFGAVFPGGLTVGGGFTMHFSSAAAVAAYLPAGTPPSPLTGNHVDNLPPANECGVFGGQVTALAINVAFGDAGAAGFADIGHLIIPQGVDLPAGPFAGWTVDQILALANAVLGGNLGALPAGISISELNGVVTSINQAFDNCNTSTEYLVEPGCDEILPVAMGTFYARNVLGGIELAWRTLSEQNVERFELQRSTNSSAWETVASVASHGNTSTGSSYSFVDRNITNGTSYSYRLSTHDLNGSVSTYVHVESITADGAFVPASFALHQNYPNPFNPSTTIVYDVAENTHVRLSVFDATGREVAVLVDRDQAASAYTVTFDATDLSTGMYFYRLEAGDFSSLRKFVVLK